jgi:flavin-dependent dehydrogenase
LCKTITILGGGPAGASAALAAMELGCGVMLIEKSKFPRHKVCGEFFSPEIEPDLARIGAWQAFLSAAPARIRRMKLNFGAAEKTASLAEPAWGLSRSAFDALLLQRAIAAGAKISRETTSVPQIIASGRKVAATARGGRLFGFKAHFEGPPDDAVELYFFGSAYVGINAVENGFTNVCGLAPEELLRTFDFDFDRVLLESPALAERVKPLTRRFDWLSTGPLEFKQHLSDTTAYRAGDALSFVDPFTGSGLVAAVKTGSLAGAAAARSDPVPDYLAQCRQSLRKPFEVAGVFRKALKSRFAETLAPLIPSRILFALTRPR